jgi:hypothetical protein
MAAPFDAIGLPRQRSNLHTTADRFIVTEDRSGVTGRRSVVPGDRLAGKS